MKVKVIIPIVIFRMFVGFSIALAAYLMMNTANAHQDLALIGFGIIFIINGISLTIYKMVLKKWDNSLTNAVLTNN